MWGSFCSNGLPREVLPQCSPLSLEPSHYSKISSPAKALLISNPRFQELNIVFACRGFLGFHPPELNIVFACRGFRLPLLLFAKSPFQRIFKFLALGQALFFLLQPHSFSTRKTWIQSNLRCSASLRSQLQSSGRKFDTNTRKSTFSGRTDL
jgi:hypothetical protein